MPGIAGKWITGIGNWKFKVNRCQELLGKEITGIGNWKFKVNRCQELLENGYQASEILIYSEIDAKNCWKMDIRHRKS